MDPLDDLKRDINAVMVGVTLPENLSSFVRIILLACCNMLWRSSMKNVLQDNYVLIVDDDPDAREVLTDIVENLRLNARSAEDGREALETAYNEPPALILLDLMMPRMDGFSTLARLRSIPGTRRVPVIVVTACGNDGRHMLMLPGVTDVVPKGSFTVESMTRLIAKILDLNSYRAVSTGVISPPPVISGESYS
jgi:CheY-like chemotaxis protein